MSPMTLFILAWVVMLLLLFLNIPIGAGMFVAGAAGLVFMVGLEPAITQIAAAVFSNVGNYFLCVVPLFILMGFLATEAGLGVDAFLVADKWLGRLPGGLAMASGWACAGFGAICGDAIATGVTIGTVAMPEMKKYKYDEMLALGICTVGGMLGFMIPPSMAFIFYSYLTAQSVGLLFAAGLLPGILITILFCLAIYIMVKRNPKLAPLGPKITWKERLVSLRYIWVIIVLFFVVLGTIYTGFAVPTEAAAAGAFATLVIGLAMRRLTWQKIMRAFRETTKLTGFLFFLIAGAFVFQAFLALTGIPNQMADLLSGLNMPTFVIVAGLLIFFLIIGMFIPVLGALVITLPFLYPTLSALNVDLIWFGVLIVVMVMIGDVSPPVGVVVYAMAGYTNRPVFQVFRGVYPFIVCMVIAAVFLVAFPEISLAVPKLISPAFWQ